MKFILTLILGLLVGALIFAAGVVYNPFLSKQNLSPLAVTDAQTVTLLFSAAATDSIVYTNDGESSDTPFPEKVLQLWERPIRQTQALATVLRDGRNQPAGLGIKFSSASEETNPLAGRALMNSVWYAYLPGRGGMFIEQSENYWEYMREVVLPGYRSSASAWTGTWLANTTVGPGALGTAIVTGGSGEFAGSKMLGVESLSVKAWRVDGGILAADGRLIVELPSSDPLADPSADIAATEDLQQDPQQDPQQELAESAL